jgi:hypothetical protein
MIQLRHDIAWVKADDGQLTPFDEERLAGSVRRAADLVGTDEHCLAESVAAAIRLFAVECVREQTISAQEVGEIVSEVLTMLGYAEIAQAYARRGERREIRLDAMASHVQHEFELGFYRELDAALQAAKDEDLSVVRVCGLRACVMRLRGAHRWGAGCRLLAEEIITHVRSRVSGLRPEGAEPLRMAVLE